MAVPAQTPKFTNQKWLVFIKDSAFATLYDVYIRNFDVSNKYQKEYSVIWFRQMWRTLCEIANIIHTLGIGTENIENAYDNRMPFYGKIQYEAKMIYSRYNGDTYNVLVIDSFDFTIPYIDVYGGRRITLTEKEVNDSNKFIINESQLRKIIRETIRELLYRA